MAQAQADPDDLEEFLGALEASMQKLEETMSELRNALNAASSWQDEVRDRFENDMLEPLQQAVIQNIEYADELKPWLRSRIEYLREYFS